MKQKLLDEYKLYDNLNCEQKNPLIKIFVSYIKPSFLYKTKILTPIHLGREIATEYSKDGVISEADLIWLNTNCIYDNDFEGNISATNRRVGFLTGTYKAWKNYDKINSPKYFGSFGYRRLFKPKFLEDLQMYDCVIPYRVDFSKTGPNIKQHVIKLQGEKTLNLLIESLKHVHPKDSKELDKYLNQTSAYMYEMYVMKKNVFFEFCEWIFPLLFYLLKKTPEEFGFKNNNSIEAKFVEESGEIRDIAYIMEILTGFYCYKLSLNKSLKVKHEEICYLNIIEKDSTKTKLMLKLLHEKLKTRSNPCMQCKLKVKSKI